uniref:LysM domain-containing protein n=1 Tax=Kalanchoe fedtschenkoi TaxID=63787 RepID=A0A7N1A3S7_KALFE
MFTLKKNKNPILAITWLLLMLISTSFGVATAKSTIEPCNSSDSCNAMLGYTLYTDLKVSEVAALFQIDPVALLSANAIDVSYPDVENHILPSRLFLKIPITCSCVDGIRKSVSTHYKTRPSDTLASISDSVYAGLVSAAQLQEANANVVSDPSVLDVGLSLLVPLPCACFNGTDNTLPAVYLSYVVKMEDSLSMIAARYQTTVTDLMNVNAMGSPAISAGDIIEVPLSACASDFPRYSSDYGLIVPNGSYAITSSHCVQCSCGPGSRKLYCMPSSLAVSCSSMQCKNSNLMIGNITSQQTSAGCNVTSCSYNGYVNGTISTSLITTLQPKCSGPQLFPPLIAPPSSVTDDPMFSPAPAPQSAGGVPTNPGTIPSTGSLPNFAPANTPSGLTNDASMLMSSLSGISVLTLIFVSA